MRDPASPPVSAVSMLDHYEGVLSVARSMGLPTTSETLAMRDLLLVVVGQGRRIAELERRLSELAP